MRRCCWRSTVTASATMKWRSRSTRRSSSQPPALRWNATRTIRSWGWRSRRKAHAVANTAVRSVPIAPPTRKTSNGTSVSMAADRGETSRHEGSRRETSRRETSRRETSRRETSKRETSRRETGRRETSRCVSYHTNTDVLLLSILCCIPRFLQAHLQLLRLQRANLWPPQGPREAARAAEPQPTGHAVDNEPDAAQAHLSRRAACTVRRDRQRRHHRRTRPPWPLREHQQRQLRQRVIT